MALGRLLSAFHDQFTNGKNRIIVRCPLTVAFPVRKEKYPL
jgi:hypothetical protein